MDYLSLKAAVAEAAGILTGASISDAWQSERSAIVLVPRRGPGLILSIDPVRPGLYLYERDKLPGRIHTTFTDLLQARIKGTTLISIKIPEHGERIVALTFAGSWPDKKGTPLNLMLEVMGRRSNLMLTEKGRILWPLRTVSKENSPARPVLAGDHYIPPPSRPGLPLENIAADSMRNPGTQGGIPDLIKNIRGLSPHSAAHLLAAVHQTRKRVDQKTAAADEGIVGEIESMLESCSGEKGFLYRSGNRIYLSPFEPRLLDPSDSIEEYSPFSKASRQWRETGATIVPETGDEAALVETKLRALLERLSSSITHVKSQEERCSTHSEIRKMAEALLINAGRVKMGLTSVQLPDPYDAGNTLTIPLDRTKSPQTNANDMFGSARRLQRGLEEVRLKRADLEDKMRTVQKALQDLVERKDMEPAAKILKGEDLNTAKKGRKSGAAHRGPGRRYIVEGFTILVGRSSTDNEKVTFRAAGPNDLWLHARDYPGSHVVVITEKKQVPDKVLYTAGSLAAKGSGARNETAPEIMVTERKWVRKLKGGKPGQVTVERYRTIRPRKSRD